MPFPVYGTDDSVVRHVSRYMVFEILKSFTAAFYGQDISNNIFNNYEPSLEVTDGELGQPPQIYKGTVVSA